MTKLRPGDTIEYLVDVSSPPNQKGIKGQTKVIDQDIPMWTTKFLLRSGKIRPYDPASPLKIEIEKTPETMESSDVPRLRIGDKIEYLEDVSSPPDQKGVRGETKVIDRDISMWTAKFLLRGGKIRPITTVSSQKIEKEKRQTKERRTRTNGQRKTISETAQTSNLGPEKTDSKRRT